MTYKIVEVIWVDAEEHGDVGWNDLKAMKRYAKKPCPTMTSVGYILHQSKTHIALASTVGTEDCSTIEKISFFNSKLGGSYTFDPVGVKYFERATCPEKLFALIGVGTSIGKRKTPTSVLSSIFSLGNSPEIFVPNGQVILTLPPFEKIVFIAFFNSINP